MLVHSDSKCSIYYSCLLRSQEKYVKPDRARSLHWLTMADSKVVYDPLFRFQREPIKPLPSLKETPRPAQLTRRLSL